MCCPERSAVEVQSGRAVDESPPGVEAGKAERAADEREDVVGTRRSHDAPDLAVLIEHEHRQRGGIEEERRVAMPGQKASAARAVGVLRRRCGVGDDLDQLHVRIEHHDAPTRRVVHEHAAARKLTHGADGAHRVRRRDRLAEWPRGRPLRRLLRAGHGSGE